MNKEQVKGVSKEIVGKIQKNAGKLVGNKSQEIKGIEKETSGIIEKKIGDVEQAVEKAGKHYKP